MGIQIDQRAVTAFWDRHGDELGGGPTPEPFGFGDSAGMADELAELVRSGPKRATAGLLDDAEEDGGVPAVGQRWIVVDGSGRPAAVIRTTEVRIGPLSSVTTRFAWDEGEGDRTRAWWLDAHERYFRRRATATGRAHEADPQVVFERFELLWPSPDSPATDEPDPDTTDRVAPASGDLDPRDLGTILGIWAHPDDEAYLMGGVMALAVDAGQHVACVTATLGDAGESADPERWPVERLREVRAAELRASLAVLGVTDHATLGLDDGHLAEVDPAGPVDELVAAIERVRPDTVITFGPDGMTGHPDHRTVSDWAARACDAASHRPRLLWATKTDDWVARFPDVNHEVFPEPLPPRTAPEDTWTLVLDGDALDRKVRALEAHASQTTGLAALLGRAGYAAWVRDECFTPARSPQPTSQTWWQQPRSAG